MTQGQDTAAHNKRLLQGAYTEVARANVQPFRELFADDVRWSTIGTTRWSKTFVGKQALRDELFGPLYKLFDGPLTNHASRFIAEDDIVVVESRGHGTTRTGKLYNNTYCIVYRMADGKIQEVTEYCDTALIDAVL